MARVFLSYSTADVGDVNRLDGALKDRVDVWLDRTQVLAGGALTPTIQAAIAERDALVVLLTPRSVQSEWVQREVAHAHALGRRIIPVTHELDIKDMPMPLKGLVGDRSAVELEPLEVARHRILSALGHDPLGEVRELVLTFSNAALVEKQEGEAKITRVEADVRWGDHQGRFRSPLGLLEADEVRWYLERYYIWPADEFENRARDIEQKLPKWGRALWDAVMAALGAAEDFSAWLDATPRPDRRALALHVDPPEPDAQPVKFRGVAALLALPWELLRDREGWLFHAHDISVRRYLPGGRTVPQAKAPIRVLVVVARPEEAGLIDPRASATALLDAVEPLGTAVQVDFLRPPTVPALVMALKTGAYHVLHFDGHGVYDRHTGLGCLCFEHEDPEERARGTTRVLSGVDLREMLANVPLPLVFLEACQTAQEGESDNAVAAALLAAGSGGVITMSHSVLVETARRFTRTLYVLVPRKRDDCFSGTAETTSRCPSCSACKRPTLPGCF